MPDIIDGGLIETSKWEPAIRFRTDAPVTGRTRRSGREDFPHPVPETIRISEYLDLVNAVRLKSQPQGLGQIPSLKRPISVPSQCESPQETSRNHRV